MLLKNFKYILLVKLISLSIGLFLLFDGIYGSIINGNIQESSETYIMIDVSHSMNTKDVFNINGDILSRLELSKDIVSELYNNKIKNKKIGIIIFSKNSNVLIPPTRDLNTIENYIKTISTGSLPSGGTNINGALELFNSISTKGTNGIIISDFGDEIDFNSQKSKIKDTINKMKYAGKSITGIGVGTKSGGVVRYPNENPISILGKNITDIRNDSFGQFITDNYYTFEKSQNKLEIEIKQNKNKNNSIKYIIGGILVLLGL